MTPRAHEHDTRRGHAARARRHEADDEGTPRGRDDARIFLQKWWRERTPGIRFLTVGERTPGIRFLTVGVVIHEYGSNMDRFIRTMDQIDR